MTDQDTALVLDTLDTLYGTAKEGFHHNHKWQLLVAIMLSAQSTDKQVEEVLPDLFDKYDTLEKMADARLEEVEEAIKSIGLYHNKARNIIKCCGQILHQHGGQVPVTLEELTALAGVGRKTATLFLSDAYDIPGVTVDTHVNRISNRLGWADSKDPVKVEQQLMKVLPRDHWIRINFQLIYHGRAICRARNPLCGKCPFGKLCEYNRRLLMGAQENALIR